MEVPCLQGFKNRLDQCQSEMKQTWLGLCWGSPLMTFHILSIFGFLVCRKRFTVLLIQKFLQELAFCNALLLCTIAGDRFPVGTIHSSLRSLLYCCTPLGSGCCHQYHTDVQHPALDYSIKQGCGCSTNLPSTSVLVRPYHEV